MAQGRKFTSFTTGPANQKPVSVLATTQINAVVGSIIQLDGRQSYDPERQRLTFKWSFTQVPLQSLLDDAKFKSLRPGGTAVSFIPDRTGLYVVQLVVNDGELDSDPVSATVNIQLSRVPIGENIIPDAMFLWDYLSDFWQLVEDREKITVAWSGYIQNIGADVLKTWSNDYNKSIATVQSTVQRRWVQFDTAMADLGVSSPGHRIIVGHTSSGHNGKSGALGQLPGVGSTESFYVPYGTTPYEQADFAKIDEGTYGAKGRVLVVNDEAYTISRVETKTYDGNQYSVVIVNERVIPDGIVGAIWRLPHLLHTPGLNLEAEGVRPGDVLVFDVIRGDTGASAELRTQVVGVDRERVGFEFNLNPLAYDSDPIDRQLFQQLVVDLKIVSPQSADADISAAAEALIAYVPTSINLATRPFSQFLITLQAKTIIRNRSIAIPEEIVSITVLQEQLKDPPVVLRENVDYLVDAGQLQFVENMFTAAEAAPKTLWAETVFIDNSQVIENNFGRLGELKKDDLSERQTRAPYLSAVKGLMFAYTNGQSVDNIRLGLQILLGLPFTEDRCVVLEIEPSFSTDVDGTPLGRILVEFLDESNLTTGVRQIYFYPTDIGLEINSSTGLEFSAGDIVEQFVPLSKGVEVTDYVKDPNWGRTAFRGLEILKYFTFKVVIDSFTFNNNDLIFAIAFLKKIKETYVKVIVTALRELTDDLVVEDTLGGGIRTHFYDNLVGWESSGKLDDDNQQGFALNRAGSRPFCTRTYHMLRDVETYKDGALVKARSVAVWGGAVRPRHPWAPIPPPYGELTVEGDILLIMPGQPGAGQWTPGAYEIKDVISDNEIQLLRVAPFTDPLDMSELPALDVDAFEYGTNLVCCIVRRQANPIVIGVDLETEIGSNIVTSDSAQFRLDGISVGDHLIIETDDLNTDNHGEYIIDAVPGAGHAYITETQLALLELTGEPAIFQVASDQQFRIIRPEMQANRIEGIRSVYNNTHTYMELHAEDPVTGKPRDVFTPGMVNSYVEVSNSEQSANNGRWQIQEYFHSGLVRIDNPSVTSDATVQAVISM